MGANPCKASGAEDMKITRPQQSMIDTRDVLKELLFKKLLEKSIAY